MHTGHNGHEVSIRYFHGGIAGVTGRPTMGSWIVYGLGSEADNLPAYMVLSDPGGPSGRWHEQLVERFHAAALPGHGATAAGTSHLQFGRAAASARRIAATEPRSLAGTEPPARAAASRRGGSGDPHRQLRAGRPHAGLGPRSLDHPANPRRSIGYMASTRSGRVPTPSVA